MADLVLWTDAEYASPWAHAAFVALEEKGVPYRLSPIDIQRGDHRHGAYAARSINGAIPSLEHGALWLGESSAIVEYVEEAFAPPVYPAILPGAVVDRALDRELRSWIRTSMYELRRTMPYEGLFLKRVTPPGVTDRARAEVARLCEVAAARWKDGLGTVSMADVELGFMLRRPIHYGVAIPAQIKEIADVLWSRPSVAKWVALPRTT